jgi:hypothetical protein
MTDDRTLLFDTLHALSLRCGYILNFCKDTSEMRCRYLHARIDELMQERREPQPERE